MTTTSFDAVFSKLPARVQRQAKRLAKKYLQRDRRRRMKLAMFRRAVVPQLIAGLNQASAEKMKEIKAEKYRKE